MSFDKEIILGYAKSKIKELKKGTTFNTKDIFENYKEYLTLSKIDKQTIGKLFKNEVELNNIKEVKLTGKKKNNSIEYIKIN